MKNWPPLLAILCITAILTLAILNGIDGALLASGTTILGGIGGYTAKARSRTSPK